jgi:WD40 repeat protein
MSKIKHLKKNTLLFLLVILSLFSLIIFSGCIDIYERSPIEFLSFSPDGTQLLSYDREDTIQKWNVSSGEELFRLDGGRTSYARTSPRFIKWLISGDHYIIGDAFMMRLFDSYSNSVIWNVSGTFSHASIASNGYSLLTSYLYYRNHQRVHNITVLDLVEHKKIGVLNTTTKHGAYLCSTGTCFVHIPHTGDSLQILNLSDESNLQNLSLQSQSVINISICHYLNWIENDTMIVLVADFFNQGKWLYYWNVTDGSLIGKINYDSWMWPWFFSSDASLFVTPYGLSDPNYISAVDAFSGEVLHRLFVSEKGVSSTTCSPDGRFIAAGSNDGIIKIWNSSTGELIQTLMTPKNYRVPI